MKILGKLSGLYTYLLGDFPCVWMYEKIWEVLQLRNPFNFFFPAFLLPIWLGSAIYLSNIHLTFCGNSVPGNTLWKILKWILVVIEEWIRELEFCKYKIICIFIKNACKINVNKVNVKLFCYRLILLLWCYLMYHKRQQATRCITNVNYYGKVFIKLKYFTHCESEIDFSFERTVFQLLLLCSSVFVIAPQ